MIFAMMYYLASVGVVGAGAYGIYYLFDEEGAKDFMARATWYSMKTYVQLNEYLRENNIIYSDNEEEEEEEYNRDGLEEKIVDRYIHYTCEPEEAIVNSGLSEKIRDDIKKRRHTDLEMTSTEINNKTYYKTIKAEDSFKDLDYIPLEKIFIQVELEQNNEKQCIHEHLDSFYLQNNKICTKAWLKWYLSKFYGTQLEDDYVVHFIDKEVNLFKINKNESVVFTSNSYEVCKENI